MELLEYWNLIIRRKWVLSVSVLVIMTTVTISVFVVKPKYEATATLLITQESNSAMVGEPVVNDLMTQTLGKSDPINTHMEMLKSRTIMNKVIMMLGLVDDDGEPMDFRALQKKIKIDVIRTTNLIIMSYRHEDPKHAAEVVNTVAAAYIEQNQQLNQEQATNARRFLEEQLAEQREKLAQAEKAVLLFKRTSNTVSLAQETEAGVDRLVQLQTSKLQVETELQGLRAQKSELQNKINAPAARTSPFYAQWLQTMEDVDSQITNLLSQKNNLDRQVKVIGDNLSDLPPKEIQLARLMRDEKIENQIYYDMLARFEEVRINEAAKIANVKLIDPPVVPAVPVFPQKGKMMSLALALSLMTGVGVILVMEYFDNTPQTVEDIEKILPYSVLGTVPEAKISTPLIVKRNPRSPLAESIRLINTNLRFKEQFQKKHIGILVTSALGGEGKSTILANLALSFAMSGKKVALVDLDLRKPTIGNIFNLKDKKGVTDYLIGESKLEDISFKSSDSGFTVIPAGTIPPNPAEIIDSSLMIQMIEQLKERYDMVFFDAPPVTMVADSLDFARHVDGLILVIDISNTPLPVLSKMCKLLKDKEIPILGTVINRVSKKKKDYQYSYGAYEHSRPYGEAQG